MIARALILVACVACVATSALAQPARKVLVLPVDGAADVQLRKQLDASVARSATALDGAVTSGNTTFAETAAAVGCNPGAAACIDEVIGTLAVDELVWGTATTTNGQTRLVVYRAQAQQPARAKEIVVGTDEAQTQAQLGSLFQPLAVPAAPTGSALPAEPADHGRRNFGIALAAGGTVMMIVAFALWANESSLAEQIEDAPTNSIDDFRALEALEDRAYRYAAIGNLLMLGGLVVGGYGAYVIYQDRTSRVVVRPTPVDGGVGVTIGGTWW